MRRDPTELKDAGECLGKQTVVWHMARIVAMNCTAAGNVKLCVHSATISDDICIRPAVERC